MATGQRISPFASGGRRGSIVALAGSLIAVLVLNALIGLFAIHYAGDADARDQETLSRLTHALDTAREAQVAFKVQVQEWKNVLLRGHHQPDYDRHLAGFENQERRVRDRLEAMAGMAAALGLDPAGVTGVRDDHAALGERYRTALARFDRADPDSVAAVDDAVRGIDRPLDAAIDAVAEAVRTRSSDVRAAVDTARAERYETLRTVAVASMLVGIVLVGAILVRTSFRAG